MRYRDILFKVGEYYPHADHSERIERYYENREIFKGNHYDILERYSDKFGRVTKESLYVSANLPSLIAKNGANFLFGEMVQINAGNGENTPEQERFDRFVKENNLNITLYENALTNNFKGDGYFKIRWGQEQGGALPASVDPFRIFIENQKAEYVFPEVSPEDSNKIVAYHIAYPIRESLTNDSKWLLQIESHYSGHIEYNQMRIEPFEFYDYKDIKTWKIVGSIKGSEKTVKTNVPFPLVVHVPNFALDDSWEGIDEITALRPLFAELNARMSAMSRILEAHADPILALPSGSLELDENGIPQFHPSIHKVIEVMDKNEILPTYITWQGNLSETMTYIKELTEKIMAIAELPNVSLGGGDAGTSGSSGLAIKFRMQSILSKTNRKRQYYEKALTQVFFIAQLLEHSRLGSKTGYEITKPKLIFRDGLPKDADAEAQRISILVSAGIMSKKSAIMQLFEYTETQAEAELERITKEMEEQNTFATPSIFNTPTETIEE